VPFIRHTRDKRGYESTVVLHVYRPGSGPQKNRVLYVFRTPAHVKLGRRALDAEVMEALEHTHPDLNFDWTSLTREHQQARADSNDHHDERHHQMQRRRDHRPPPPSRPAQAPRPVETPVTVRVDESTLGRALGAEEAARVRQRYAQLMERVSRRARSDEERDRLTGRAARLNPDEWPDEASVRAALPGAEAEWSVIGAELPSRRRGRRGGRHRQHGERPAGAGSSAPASDIIEDDGEADASPTGSGLDAADRDADGDRDRGGDGPESDSEPTGDPAGDD
jgi:hypothetical protein